MSHFSKSLAMGIKSIKEKYKIKHIIQKCDGNICIGSGYVHDIIKISPDGELIKVWDRNSSNPDLKRYIEEMSADELTGELKRLFHEEDSFRIGELKPIFTTKAGFVILALCEKYGYPNTTIEGEIMYENTFFMNYSDAIEYLKKDTQLGVKHSFRNFNEILIDSIERVVKSGKYLFRNIWYYIMSRTINSIVWVIKSGK